jgi:hypothetical protein
MPHQIPVKTWQDGQSLLEMVVLIGLALVIVTGLTIVTVNGLKNSQFSQNQAQATRLTQEAIDCVRTAKDKNLPVCVDGTWNTVSCDGGTAYYWYDRETASYVNQIWGDNAVRNYKILTNVSSSCVGLQSVASGEKDTSLGPSFSSTFTRTIRMQHIPVSSDKRVTVNVSWSDISGMHQSNLATILSRY